MVTVEENFNFCIFLSIAKEISLFSAKRQRCGSITIISGVMEMTLLKLKLILEVGVDSHDFSKAWTFHQLYIL